MEETGEPRRAARVRVLCGVTKLGRFSPMRRAVVGGKGIGRMILRFTFQWERVAGLYNRGPTRSHSQQNRQFAHS